MENEKIPEIKDWGLNNSTIELLWDFKTSPDYYHKWLLYLNDLLIAIACDNVKHCADAMECLVALKHIRNLLDSLQTDAQM